MTTFLLVERRCFEEVLNFPETHHLAKVAVGLSSSSFVTEPLQVLFLDLFSIALKKNSNYYKGWTGGWLHWNLRFGRSK